MNPIPSNSKIKYFLLSILFTILFIFTALQFQHPITAQAEIVARTEDGSGIGQGGEENYIINGVEINGTSVEGSVSPKYLYWAGDSQRSGVLFYVIDLETNKGDNDYQPFVLLCSEEDSNGEEWYEYVNSFIVNTRAGFVGIPDIYFVETLPTPVYFDEGDQSWYPNGDAVKGHMLEEVTTYQYQMLKYWVRYGHLTTSQLQTLKEGLNNNKLALAFETVSAQSFFTNSNKNSVEMAGDIPYKALTGAYDFASRYKKMGISGLEGSTANWKWFQAVQGSMILEEDMAGIVRPTGNTSIGTITSSEAAERTNGYGIMITTINLPPIHTLSEINGTPQTPGPPETPSEENNTTGDCTIKKLYYTQVLNPDGTVNEEKDFKPFSMSGTTNYISIDTEDDYEIEGWKTSSSEYNLTNKSEWDAIPDGSQHGTSSDTIKLEDESGCLYVLYKKVEQLEEEDTPIGVIFFAHFYIRLTF